MVSVSLLIYCNTSNILESIDGLHGIKDKEEEAAAIPDAKGTIVIVFAGLGLTFDFVCFFTYRLYAKKDVALKYKEIWRKLERNGESVDDALHKKIKKPHINMFSVLIHVSANLF